MAEAHVGIGEQLSRVLHAARVTPRAIVILRQRLLNEVELAILSRQLRVNRAPIVASNTPLS